MAFEQCLDVIYPELEDLTLDELEQVLLFLGASHLPVNKAFLLRAVARIGNLLRGCHHLLQSRNINVMRKTLHLFSSLSLIETNMNLASAYLPELDTPFLLALSDLRDCLSLMKDADFTAYCSCLRRSCLFDQTLLSAVITEAMRRQVKEVIIKSPN